MSKRGTKHPVTNNTASTVLVYARIHWTQRGRKHQASTCALQLRWVWVAVAVQVQNPNIKHLFAQHAQYSTPFKTYFKQAQRHAVQMTEIPYFLRGVFVIFLAYYWSHLHSASTKKAPRQRLSDKHSRSTRGAADAAI